MGKLYHSFIAAWACYAPGFTKSNIWKRGGLRVLMFLTVFCSLGNIALGQISITNELPVKEDFDGMGAALALPLNWKIAESTNSPTWALATGSVKLQSSSGAPTTGGTYNWGSSPSERSVGAMSTGTFPSPNNLLSFYVNNGVSNITQLNIEYDAERYRINTAVASIQFYYSLDGSTWISVPSGDMGAALFPTGSSSYGYPIETKKNILVISGLNIIPGSNFYLRWNINTTGANSQGIGIDNVSVSATFASTENKLSFINIPTTGFAGVPLAPFTVEARKIDNSLDNNFSGNITLTKTTGPGTIAGTLTANAIGGVATFNNITFSQPGNYSITASSVSLINAISGTITIDNSSSNIFGGDGVNWSGANQNPLGYVQPVNCLHTDFRVLKYRKVNTTLDKPADGRGQWITTINTQITGGNVFNSNMPGGDSKGFLFTSGNGCGNTGTSTNKWNFSGIAQCAIDAVNGVDWNNETGGNDIGVNMTNPGRYTFVLKDAGYTSTAFYVGYTTNDPVLITHNPVTQRTINADNSTTIRATLNNVPSSQEKFYIRYSTVGNNFSSTGSTFITTAGIVVGYEVIITISDLPADATIYYYIFSSTMSQVALTALIEGYRSFALLNYADNAGDNYSYLNSAATLPTDYFRSNVSQGNWQSPSSWQSSHDNINWFSATAAPTGFAKGIAIKKASIITLTSNTTAKLLTIEAGGTLTNTNTAGGYLLTIEDDGTPASDFNIYGTYILFGTAPKFNIGATATVYQDGVVRADDNVGGNSHVFASSNSVLFKTGSVFEWNNNNAFSIDGMIYFPNSTGEIPIFRFSKTPAPLGTTNLPTTFNGIVEINSNITFTGTGLKIFRDGIRGKATLIQGGTGEFAIQTTNAILDGPSLKIILIALFRFYSSVIIPVGAHVTITGHNIDNNKTLNVLTVNGTLDVTTSNINNTNGSVIINGSFRTASAGGFSGGGASIVSGIINVNPGSTIELYASGNQDLITRADFSNLIFSGSGIKNPKNTFVPKGTVTIKDDAILDCGSHKIGDGTTSGPTSTNLVMSGNSRLIVSAVGPSPSIAGNYNLTGGVIEFKNSSLTAQTIITKSYQNIEITGNNVKNSGGNITLNTNGTFTVKNGGIFEINANSITCPSGGGTVTVENGGVFLAGNNQGFNGFTTTSTPPNNSSVHSNITNIILQPGSTVDYSRSIPQLSTDDQPITNANNLVYQNLSFSGTGNKTAPAGTLIIQGNLIKSGTANFIHNNGTVMLNGTSAQTYTCSFPIMRFNNLTNQNAAGVHINNDLAVYKQLLLGTNSKTILNTGNVHLKSDNNSTANVAPVPDNATINYAAGGRFVVERYIANHSKAWQLLAAPTKGSTVNATWQEGNIPGGNTNPGFGTQITSNVPNATNLGFDQSSGSPSMKTYNSATNQWEGIASTKDLLIENTKGYFLFVRGDRSVTGISQPSTATTLRTVGKIYAPGLEAPAPVYVPENSFASLGNPYASAINFGSLKKTGGVTGSYYIWDPLLTTSEYSAYGYGGFRTVSFGYVSPASGQYNDVNNIPEIQSGQAFFVYASTPGTVTFSEDNKVSGSISLFKPMKEPKEPMAQLRTNLYVFNNEVPILLDGTLIQFDSSYSNELDNWDAMKIYNSGENMSIASNGKNITIERRQIPVLRDTLFYNVEQMQQREYQFELIGSYLDEYGMEAFLEDNYLHTRTQLSLTGVTLIKFIVNNTVDSRSKNRFHIVFSAAAGPLPATFVSLKGYQQNKNIAIEWKMENERDINIYTVEKSAEGNRFIPANIKTAKNMNASTYNWLDTNPFDGNNYYRIKSTDINGEEKYSQIVRVFIGKSKPSIIVYPNPVIDGIINLQLENQVAGKYQARLLNALRQVMVLKDINHFSGNSSQTILFNKHVPHGVYHLEVISPNGEITVLKINTN